MAKIGSGESLDLRKSGNGRGIARNLLEAGADSIAGRCLHSDRDIRVYGVRNRVGDAPQIHQSAPIDTLCNVCILVLRWKMSTTEWKNEVELSNCVQNPVKLRKVLLNEKGQRIEGPVEGLSISTGIPKSLSSYESPILSAVVSNFLRKCKMIKISASEASRILRSNGNGVPRKKVNHLCPKCNQIIIGTRNFRTHLPKCKE